MELLLERAKYFGHLCPAGSSSSLAAVAMLGVCGQHCVMNTEEGDITTGQIVKITFLEIIASYYII